MNLKHLKGPLRLFWLIVKCKIMFKNITVEQILLASDEWNAMSPEERYRFSRQERKKRYK